MQLGLRSKPFRSQVSDSKACDQGDVKAAKDTLSPPCQCRTDCQVDKMSWNVLCCLSLFVAAPGTKSSKKNYFFLEMCQYSIKLTWLFIYFCHYYNTSIFYCIVYRADCFMLWWFPILYHSNMKALAKLLDVLIFKN